ncbi:MAG TPA: hypothetical protein PLQ54_14130, partial [Armatimonadota bacterium]|nr:hypothetical protein [Armatimonadota bacterium]
MRPIPEPHDSDELRIHQVRRERYEDEASVLGPVLLRLRQQGKSGPVCRLAERVLQLPMLSAAPHREQRLRVH